MSETPKGSDRRLQQLENLAEAKSQMGEASAIEAAVPELVAEIFALRAERDRLQTERHVAIELINAEGLPGDHVYRLDAIAPEDHTAHDGAPAGSGAESSLSSEAVLHLYPLADEHGDAMVSGNHKGLRILKERLERALRSTAEGAYYMDHGYTDNKDEQIFAADGEEYHITVECRPASVHDPSWQQRPEPYYVSRRFARESGIL